MENNISNSKERLRGPRISPDIRRENLADYWVQTSWPITDDGLVRATVSLEDANKATNNHTASTNRDRQWPMERILQECSSVEGIEVIETPGLVFKLSDSPENRALVAGLDSEVLPEGVIDSLHEMTKGLEKFQILALASYIIENVANKPE
jgi:hypothetical protein